MSSTILRRMMMGATLLAVLAASGCAHLPNNADAGGRAGATLPSFADTAELAQYHRELVESILSKPPLGAPPAYIPPPPPPPMPGDTVRAPEPAPAPEPPPESRIYGDPLVRAHGDYLLVLRKGRLSTIRVAGGALEAVETVDALGPGVGREEVLFHGLLVSGDTVWVVGSRGVEAVTESLVALFRVDGRGGLEHLAGGVLHAPRGLHDGGVALLRDGRLVLYDNLEVPVRHADVFAALPSLPGADGGLATTAAPERIYRSVYPMSWPHNPELHVVTVCGWKAGAQDCASTAAYAPMPTAVHVSPTAVYLRSEYPYAEDGEDEDDDGDRAVLIRLPLDGSAATGLQVTGASTYRPESFMESADGHLNALVSHDGWTEEDRSRVPRPALMRVPHSAFGDGRGEIDRRHYRLMPRLPGPYYSRFVGEWLVHGARSHDPYLVDAGLQNPVRREALSLGVQRWADTAAPAWYPIRTPTQALEPLGDDAVLALVGSGDSLRLAYVVLGTPLRAAAAARAGVRHFNGVMYGVVHHPDGPDSGLLGISIGVRPTEYTWRATSAAFLRYDAAGIRNLGELAPRGELSGDDEVVPVFAHGRIFALLGDELAEAVEENGHLREVRRIQVP